MLPRFFYVPLLLVALIGVTFGIGTMFGLGMLGSGPSSPSPKATTGATFTSRPKVVDKNEPVEATAKRGPSPIYPASPGSARESDNAPAQAEKASTQQDATARRDGFEPTSTSADDERNAPAGSRDDAAANERSKAASAAPPRSNRCDIAACASAYHSFRESDCTYQPFSGPRQMCDKTAAESALASAPRTRHDEGRRQDRRFGPGFRDEDARAFRDEDVDDVPRRWRSRRFLVDPDDDW